MRLRIGIAALGYLCWIASFSFEWLDFSDSDAFFVVGPVVGGVLIGAATLGRARGVALAVIGLMAMIPFSLVMLGWSAANEGGGLFSFLMALIALTALGVSAGFAWAVRRDQENVGLKRLVSEREKRTRGR